MTWAFDRLVLERIATLQELETHYSLDDVVRINRAHDALARARAAAAKRV